MRKKVKKENKKVKLSLTIDDCVVSELNKHLVETDIKNTSKFIEELIIKDLENRGIVIKKTEPFDE